MSTKPKYIQEIEAHTGLTCLPSGDRPLMYWSVMSPTGVALFEVGSHDNDLIGSISQPDMYEVQGIDQDERSARRRA